MGHFQIPPPSGHFPLYFMQQDRRGECRTRGRVRRNTGRGWGPTSLADATLWSSSRKTENAGSGWKTLSTGPACGSPGFLQRLHCGSGPAHPLPGPLPWAAPSLKTQGKEAKGTMGKEVGRGGKAAEIHNCLGEDTRETCALEYRLQGYERSLL